MTTHLPIGDMAERAAKHGLLLNPIPPDQRGRCYLVHRTHSNHGRLPHNATHTPTTPEPAQVTAFHNDEIQCVNRFSPRYLRDGRFQVETAHLPLQNVIFALFRGPGWLREQSTSESSVLLMVGRNCRLRAVPTTWQAMAAPSGSWAAILAGDPSLSHLLACDELQAQDVTALIQRVRHDRVGVLATLKALGVKLSDRQKLACALARQPRLVAAAVAAHVPTTKPRVPLVVAINVHELPTFVIAQLRHIHAHLPFEHRVILNCNDDMHEALRSAMPSAFAWDASECARTICHPQPLNKRRFHGSLLQGIMRNMQFAHRRWDFDSFLVLSSRSWFRRSLSLQEVTESRSRVPAGASRAMLQHTADGIQFVDVSHTSRGLEIGSDAAGQGALLTGYDWWPLLRTKLAFDGLVGQVKLQGPHEGLLLERA